MAPLVQQDWPVPGAFVAGWVGLQQHRRCVFIWAQATRIQQR